MKRENCPEPALILQALAEGGPAPLVEHVHTCALCQRKPVLQEALRTWQVLDVLSAPKLSGSFEARLQARLRWETRRQTLWLRLDSLFNLLHIPALAALTMLLLWLPQPRSPVQAHHWERPWISQPLREGFPIQTPQTLDWLKKIYRQRSEKG